MTIPRKAAPAAPRKTTSTSTFTSAQPQQRHLTRERIAEDMAAFGKAGGTIEVLGNTPLRGKDSKATSSSDTP